MKRNTIMLSACLLLCMLWGCNGKVQKTDMEKKDDSQLVETVIGYLPEVTYVYSLCQKDEKTLLLFGKKEGAETPLALYVSGDQGSTWKEEDAEWTREISELSGENGMIMGGDMTKTGVMAVHCQNLDEKGERSGNDVVVMEPSHSVHTIS